MLLVEADEIQLYPSRDVNVSVFDGEQCKIESEIILPRFIYAPIRKGKAEGKIIFRVNGKIIGCADLIAKEECKEVIHEKGFLKNFSDDKNIKKRGISLASNELIRIQKIIADAGIASRRKAEELIQKAW